MAVDVITNANLAELTGHEIESSLSSTFLRTHKSYIVNKTYIEKIDKTNRLAVLINGEDLPISNSQYSKVLEDLSPKI